MTNLAPPVGEALSTTAGNDTSAPSVPEMMVEPIQTKQNVVYGMNYSVPAVDAFVTSSDFGRRRNSQDYGSSSDSGSNNGNTTEKETASGNNTQQDGSQNGGLKRSRRERKTRVSVTKTQVRYLVSEVPLVCRNREFLQPWRDQKEKENTIPELRRSQPSRSAKVEAAGKSDEEEEQIIGPYPFGDENSVVWVPPERSYWVDSLNEMVAVCTSAALRRHDDLSKPFYPPLSRDYVRDRVDIDDPLIGYQIRHRHGGWLQGFLMFTNFTTWSHYFKWDSTHQASGLPEMGASSRVKHLFDTDGSLGRELEEQPRAGDPLAGGVVFPTIAEISLVGGLGCGEYLLRMALDDIRSRESYKFVALQATDTSKSFYEKFGFVRVGAISKYSEQKITARIVQDPQLAALSDIVGYRHWTYAHESEQSLGEHGGPSYMMALRLEEDAGPSFLNAMKPAFVEEKPQVKLIGTPTPGSLKKKTLAPFGSPLAAPNLMSLPGTSTRKRRRNSAVQRRGFAKRTSAKKPTKFVALTPPPPHVPAQPTNSSRRRSAAKKAPVSERRPTSTTAKARYGPLGAGAAAARKPGMTLEEQRDILMAPPKVGTRLSYNQKQYQSIWLAVPPVAPSGGRKPPRERDPLASRSFRKRKRNDLVAEGTEATLLGAANEIDHLSNIRLKFQLERKKPALFVEQASEALELAATGDGPLTSALMAGSQAKSQHSDVPKLMTIAPAVMADESRDDDEEVSTGESLPTDEGKGDDAQDVESAMSGCEPPPDLVEQEERARFGSNGKENDPVVRSADQDLETPNEEQSGRVSVDSSTPVTKEAATVTTLESPPESSQPVGIENNTAVSHRGNEETAAQSRPRQRNEEGTTKVVEKAKGGPRAAVAGETFVAAWRESIISETEPEGSAATSDTDESGSPNESSSSSLLPANGDPAPGSDASVGLLVGERGQAALATKEANELAGKTETIAPPPNSSIVSETKNGVIAEGNTGTKGTQKSPSKRSMRKQRMISIPRTIPRERQLYSKVIRPKGGAKDKFYFVLNYDHDKDFVKMIELTKVGQLTGKRAGRPRYRALLDTSPILTSDNATDYEIVKAYMVTKTAMVEKENWDILEED